MAQQAYSDLYKRHRTDEPLVSYRLRRDGSKTYYVQHGGTHVPAGATLRDAKEKKAELGLAKAKGQIPERAKLFSDLAEEWLEIKTRHIRPRTADYYRSSLELVLLPRFGKLKVDRITVEAVSRLILDLERDGLGAIDSSRPKRPLGRSSIENYLKPAEAIMKLARSRHMIAVSPFDLLTADERPKREEQEPPHEWTDDELAALLRASGELAAKPESRHDYTPLLRLTSRLGLRCGEVLGLQWQDFQRDTGHLHIRRQWLRSGEYGPTKTKAGVRSLALSDDLREELIALRLASPHSQDEDPIFASREGTPLGHRNLTRRGWEPARTRAGLPSSLTFHDLRHAVASRLIAKGLSPVVVAKVMGHKDSSVTLRIYAHLFDRQKTDDAVRAALAEAI